MEFRHGAVARRVNGKVLLVGGGGREHAIAWKLRQDEPDLDLVVAPGNAGIAGVGRCVAAPAANVVALVELALQERPDLVVVGPEAPLAAGISEELERLGIPVFGPTSAAALIESSKAFAKALMLSAGIPTATARAFRDVPAARSFARELGAPVVIKASGLAAGKGVIICDTLQSAEATIDGMLRGRLLGEAGTEILVEEFMEGEELSVLVVTDGERYVEMLPARDHKRLGDGDTGPNTGGMGAYAPVRAATPELLAEVRRTIIEPTLAALRRRGTPFRGVLYAGLMLTKGGPKVVEFNCRFGDPEAQVVIPLMTSPLRPLLESAARGELDEAQPAWRPRCAVTTVIAAHGYPDRPRLGDPVMLPPPMEDVIVFHAGTALASDGALVTSGGRVLNVTAIAPTLAEAAERSRSVAEAVQLEGKQLRRDIALREITARDLPV